jgi:hypothetical protein
MGQCVGLHCAAPGQSKNAQAIHTWKRNLHQIESEETIDDLCVMHITIHVFVYICVQSSMPSL